MSEYKQCFGHYAGLFVQGRNCMLCNQRVTCIDLTSRGNVGAHLGAMREAKRAANAEPSLDYQSKPVQRSKYHREIKPGVWIDVYDVLQAFDVRSSALQHVIKKALAAGQRGHKDRATDLDEIVQSAVRAKELG